MVEGQRTRFEQVAHLETIQNYVERPEEYEKAYLELLESESVAQYRDYFRSEDDEFDNAVFRLNRRKFSVAF